MRPLRTVRAPAHVGLPHLCLDKHHPASTPLIRLRRCRRPSPERAAITADQSQTTDTGKARFRKARPRATTRGAVQRFSLPPRATCICAAIMLIGEQRSATLPRFELQDSNCKIGSELSQRERAVRAGTERLISTTAGSRPVPSLNFGEASGDT